MTRRTNAGFELQNRSRNDDNDDGDDDNDDDSNDEDEDDLRRNKIDQVESNCKMDFFLNQDQLN